MKIKISRTIDVPEKYCYDDTRKDSEQCGWCDPSYPRCLAFDKILTSEELEEEGTYGVFRILPCEECLNARKDKQHDKN
jgi:hypothetical protein